MSAFFENLLLPGADPAAVSDALCQWYTATGYTRDTSRQLFDYKFQIREERVFIISNEKWCQLLYNDSSQETEKLFTALASFPALVQFWADDDVWGFRLQEYGKLTTTWLSKLATKSPTDPYHPASEALTILTKACGIPQALPRLLRAQRKHSFFLRNKCAGIAEALDVPLAAHLDFYELDRFNEGITEPRQIPGYTCQLLCFKKATPAPVPRPMPPTPTTEQRAAVAQFSKKLSTKWLRLLILPFTLIGSLLVLPLVGGLVLVAYLSRFTFLRKIFLGKSIGAYDQFLKRLQDSRPKTIRFQGGNAINTRHDCSIISHAPAIVHPDPPANHKGPPQEPPVFEVKLGENYLFCEARGLASKSRRHGTEILETRVLTSSAFPISFQKVRHHHLQSKTPFFDYYWDLETPRAHYTFSSGISKNELTPADVETMEKIVLSFKA